MVRYQNLGLLADGGMAEISIGRDPRSNELVAIKRIKRPFDRDPAFVQMFADEATLWEKLRHPNIVRLLAHDMDDEGPYIAMELVDGVDVASLLVQNPDGLSMGFVFVVAIAIADALSYLHAVEDEDAQPMCLVHRDISPGNVLCGCDGSVKLTDFGVAQAAIKTHHTQVGDLKGKFAYMSPEQTRGEALTAQSDLFALGIVIWEMLASRPLFDRENDIDTAQAVRMARVPKIDRADVCDDLNALIAELLSVDLTQRPANADGVARRLRTIARAHAIVLSPQAVADVVGPLTERIGTTSARLTPCARRRTLVAPLPATASTRSLPIVLGGIGIAALLGLAVWGVKSMPLFEPERVLADGGQTLTVEQAVVGANAVGADVVDVAVDSGTTRSSKLAHSPTSSLANENRSTTTKVTRRPIRQRHSVPDASASQADANAATKIEVKGFGSLDLNAEPWAEVAIDGVALGRTTPLRDFSLAAGKHRITLHNPVFKMTYSFVIQVVAGERVRKIVDLTAQASAQSPNR
jgi:serine/threonine-protein kinase